MILYIHRTHVFALLICVRAGDTYYALQTAYWIHVYYVNTISKGETTHRSYTTYCIAINIYLESMKP